MEQRYYQHIEGVVQHVADSQPTNLIAWYVQDEPNLEILPFVRHSAEITRKTDPRRPTTVVLCHSLVLEAYREVVDILSPDPYPGFPGGPMLKVANFLDEARRVVQGRKPVMAVLQAFGEPPGPEGTMPTPAELRNMTYLALVHQARGLLYFSYSYNGPMREAHPAHWAELKKLAGEVRDLAPALAAPEGNRSAQRVEGPAAIHTRVIQHDETACVIAVNTSRQAIEEVQWQTMGFQDGPLEVVREDRTVPIEGGRFSDQFQPLEVHVYRQRMKE